MAFVTTKLLTCVVHMMQHPCTQDVSHNIIKIAQLSVCYCTTSSAFELLVSTSGIFELWLPSIKIAKAREMLCGNL